jgi:hypothetical protein
VAIIGDQIRLSREIVVNAARLSRGVALGAGELIVGVLGKRRGWHGGPCGSRPRRMIGGLDRESVVDQRENGVNGPEEVA